MSMINVASMERDEPELLVSFATAAEATWLATFIRQSLSSDALVRFSKLHDVKLHGLQELLIARGVDDAGELNGQTVSLTLSEATLDEVISKLDGIANAGQGCHDYVEVGPNLVLRPSIDEYPDAFFARHWPVP